MFHWDVTPGFYRVTATRNGCRAKHERGAATAVFSGNAAVAGSTGRAKLR